MLSSSRRYLWRFYAQCIVFSQSLHYPLKIENTILVTVYRVSRPTRSLGGGSLDLILGVLYAKVYLALGWLIKRSL